MENSSQAQSGTHSQSVDYATMHELLDTHKTQPYCFILLCDPIS